LRHLALALVVVAAPAALCGTARAQVRPEDLDRILGALAEVIKDRAKEVAADTLRTQLKGDLCAGEKTLVLKNPPGAKLVLQFKGSPKCAEGTDPCTADDVFVASCRLLDMDDIDVTDPQLLRTVGQDTVSFALRIGVSSLNAAEYKRLRFPELATYVFELMASMQGRRLDTQTVIDRTLEFADSLGRDADQQLAEAAIKAVADAEATTKVVQNGYDLWKGQCVAPGPGKRAAVSDAGACSYGATLPAPDGGLAAGSPACAAYVSKRTERRQIFKSLFDEDKPFHGALHAACSQAVPQLPPAQQAAWQAACNAAQLANLLDALYATRCKVAQASDEARSTFRRLIYLLFQERAQFDEALRNAKQDTPELKAIADALKPQLQLGQGAALAAVLRVVTSGIRSHQSDSGATATFLEALRSDVGRVHEERKYLAILHGKALGWQHRDDLKSAELKAFRDAVKNLLALPVFVLGVESVPQAQIETATKLVSDILSGIAKLRVTTSSPEDAVRAAANLMATLSGAITDLERKLFVPQAVADAKQSVVSELRAVSTSLDMASRFLTVASEHNWVAIALGASLEIASVSVPKVRQPELVRSLAFLRLLMSVYQAETKEDAKAIFQSALVQKGSRRQRFQRFSIDVAAALGARIGLQTQRTVLTATGETQWTDASRFGGLYAPVGVQFANEHLGFLLYPIDLGAYLVAKPGSDEVHSWDAIRPGGALMWRFSARYPIDFLLSADYLPEIQGHAPQWRFAAALTLELPLYMIY
jgi:hypothetical protein